MRIRPALGEELSDVGDLTVAGYAEFTRDPDDPYVAKLRDAESRARDAQVWVAEEDDALLGTVTFCPPGSPLREISRDGEGEFRMLAVAPEARGQGVGEALVRHCLDLSRASGERSVVLSSLPQMTAAHRIYHRLGFERLPDRDWSPLPGVDLVAFHRELT